MVNVVLYGSGKHQDVIHVHKDKLVEYVLEEVIDQGLEDGRSIGEAERHDQILVVAGG